MKQLVVSNLKVSALNVNRELEILIKKLKKEGLSAEPSDFYIIKKSLDARDKANIDYIYSVAFKADFRASQRLSGKCSYQELKAYVCPEYGLRSASARHIIVGAGPAGLFAGLLLARNGYKPLIIERGQPVTERAKTIDEFWRGGTLNTESNVCFGEGGAGTFSDGKLTTGVKDSFGREGFVLSEFVKAGADPEIMYWHKPHLGTDKLRDIVKNIRNEILELGGEFYFNTKVDDISQSKNGLRLSLLGEHKGEIPAETVILASGHSARDTYKMLLDKGADMVSKDFAVGVRIEHPQDMIQLSQYGCLDYEHLPVADYKLTARSGSGRGVYSFCMCPGGQVVNSATEAGEICVNGMSNKARDGRNANSALIVTVGPKDFGSALPLAGIAYQRALEEKAFSAGKGQIPVQLFGDFVKGKVSAGLGDVDPDIKGGYSFGDVRGIFDNEVSVSLVESIYSFGKRISGFDRADAVLSGVEARTSSPVRIIRDENYESNIKGLFPCGEGAGYAGGIMSAAMDGLRVAEEIIRRYKP